MKRIVLLSVLLLLSLSLASSRRPPKDVPSDGSIKCGGQNNCVCAIFPGEGAVIGLDEEMFFKWQIAETNSWYDIYLDGVKLATLRPGTNTYSFPACYVNGNHTWKVNAYQGVYCSGSVTVNFRTANP